MSAGLNADPMIALSPLERAALLLGQSDEVEALLNAVLTGVARLSGAGRIDLLVADFEKGGLHPLAACDAAGQQLAAAYPGQVSPIIEQAVSGGETRHVAAGADWPAALVIPLRFGGRSLGAIVASDVSAGLTDTDLPALQGLANQAAAALESANLTASIQSLEQDRREFVSLTTHQLRVPLTSISGYADLMLSGIVGSLGERQEQFLLTIRRNVDRMSILISDLSDLNRIDDGRMPMKATEFDLGDLVDATLQEQALAITGQGHELQLQLTADLPLAYGDRPAIKRVFDKILTNAITYTPEGGALIVEAVGQGRLLQITVTDTGIGMNAADRAQLFTPFFRSEEEGVREHVGWGLSLALAKALVELQGGQLWCESEPGQGSAFHFTIPAAGTEQELPASTKS
jgi:signal transduction histidine kinase